jgi:pyruvate,orthophosphate dikinase
VFLEEVTGSEFGGRRKPLLVSVRSGAARSMPGMLDTVLNIGATPAGTRGLLRQTGNPHFAWDCRRRLIEGFAEAVYGFDPRRFTAAADMQHGSTLPDLRQQRNDALALEATCSHFERQLRVEQLHFPDDAMEQLHAAALAVFYSWNSDRAIAYRRLQGLDDLVGTAITVQAMVYGNADSNSAAGVAFSRDPSTGAPESVIDILFEAQGEDIVSGRVTPSSCDDIARKLPSVALALRSHLQTLEREFGDVQDVEFTVASGQLFILQTRAAKRTPRATLRFAVDLAREGIISPTEALTRTAQLTPQQTARTRLVNHGPAIAVGQSASPGIAEGRAAFSVQSVKRLADAGEAAVLCRPDISTADVEGFAACTAIVTTIGGRTAHAALVARQMGKPCVTGCHEFVVDDNANTARSDAMIVHEGDWITVDGDSGSIYAGRSTITFDTPDDDFHQLEIWRRENQPRQNLATDAV